MAMVTPEQFQRKAMWLLPVKGTFAATEGVGAVNEGRVTGRLVIAAVSVDATNKRRDEHLRGRDFLSVAQYPSIAFDVKDAHLRDGGQGSINGELAIHGVTRPLTLQCCLRVDDITTVVLDARATVNRADFRVTWGKMGAGPTSSLAIHATFVRVEGPNEMSLTPTH
jgi:polyisoprenoid-binding protein YceI